MGRTVLSFRQALGREIDSWSEFRRGLQPRDREQFDKLMDMARHRADASSLVARPLMSESIFMSMLTGMMKIIEEMRVRIDELEKQYNRLDTARKKMEKK
ncbi:MAG: hypothetical protein ACTSUE_26280 [Promethearchaeota archaeon]